MGIRTKRHVCAARLLPSGLSDGSKSYVDTGQKQDESDDGVEKAHKHLDHLVLVVAPGNELKQ